MNMYPPTSSTSSSPQKAINPGGLTRYGSAPGAFLTRAVDSVIGTTTTTHPDHHHHHHHHQQQYNNHVEGGGGGGEHHHHFMGSPVHHVQYFSSAGGTDSSTLTSESTSKVNSSSNGGGEQQRSGFGLNEIAHGAGSLIRQKSSPAGFLSHLVSDSNGFSVTRCTGSGFNTSNSPTGNHLRLKSQLSFTRQDSQLSQISEASESVVEGISSDLRQNTSHGSYTFGSMDSWNNGNSIAFSGPPRKRAKNIDADLFNCVNTLETQFSMPQTTLEMATMERLLNIPEDSVPCKVRAKRGCATHPRSIAERERRTRISGKLKKLQELVPNMDKQTNYSDMLDLAVQHIKGLQDEVQKLNKELEHCTCGCKPKS